jgi:hypothetical protein
MKTRFPHAAAFGLATAMAVIVLALILYMADMKNTALNYLSYPIGITIACIGVKKWRDQNGGFLSFKQAYGHLFFQLLVYSAIMTVWTLIFIIYIAPGLMEDQMLITQAKMEDEGKMSSAQIETAMHYARMFTSPGVLAVLTFFGTILFGCLINLVIAAIMKKDPPPAPFFPPANPSYPNMPQGGPQNTGNPYPQNFPPPQNNPPQQ